MADPALVNITESGSNTADTTPDVAYPAYASGDLVMIHIATDGALPSITAPSGPDGETLTEVDSASSGIGSGGVVYQYIAAGTQASGTLAFGFSIGREWQAFVGTAPGGDFDASAPIDAFDAAGYGSVDNPASRALTAGAAGGQVVNFFGIDIGAAVTTPSGWTQVGDVDVGDVKANLAVRDAATTLSESVASATWALSATRNTVAVTYIIAPSGAAPSGNSTLRRILNHHHRTR